jgi:hypothetical protein
MDIEANLKTFIGEAPRADARYTSFDYCFNHFQSFHEQDRAAEIAAAENVQLSCLHLAFYLASWGMFRPSSILHLKSLKHYEPVVHVIAAATPLIWQIDAHCYSDEAWDAIQELDHQIRSAFHHPNGASDVLVTKVLLGVFGQRPCLRHLLRRGFRSAGFGRANLARRRSGRSASSIASTRT